MSEIEPTDATTPERELDEAVDAAGEMVAIQASELDELAAEAVAGGRMDLAHLRDVPVRVTVEVGRAQITLGELVQLGAGSLVELENAAHEPASVLVNGKVVARGEIITIGDRYGVRVTEVPAAS